jgi:uncharacterized protein with ParB-like and HNH nuclease domain
MSGGQMPKPDATIESELETVGHVLNTDFRYRVPAYQRNFSWTLEEVERLWEDINQAIEENRPEYFLGTIVVEEDRTQKFRTVIDGQQRLAALSMIVAGIRSVYEEYKDERSGEVYNDYLGIRDRRTRLTQARLTLNALNEPQFQKFVVDNTSDEELKLAAQSKTLDQSNILLTKATLFFRAKIQEKAKVSTKYENFLLALEEFVRDRIILILVSVGDEADAYLIFETLNDRGLELSISDLLKNYIFGKAGDRVEVVKGQWQEMAFLLGSQNQAQFLRHYWLSHYGVIRDRDLYKEIKKKFSNPNSVLAFMTDLREAADKYTALSNVDHPIWQNYGEAVRKDLEILQLFSLSQFRPLMLAALDVLDENDIAKLIHIIVMVSMRYSIIGSLGPGNIEKAYSDAAIAIRKRKADTAAKVFALLKGIYPDDTRFISDFAEKEISKSKIARYILSEIAQKKQGSKILRVTEDEKISTLEHIMPKSRVNSWTQAAKDNSEYIAYIHRLGNLTLLEREYNKVASTDPFKKKVEGAYKKSTLQITTELANYETWTIKEISERQAELARIAANIWRLPYQ